VGELTGAPVAEEQRVAVVAEEQGLHGVHRQLAVAGKRQRVYLVFSSGYAARDTAQEGSPALTGTHGRLNSHNSLFIQ
jgi:hypothetical protein